MAEVQVTTNAANASENTTTAHIPIAQLTPLLAAPASRSIKAVVTLTWPYSSVSGSIAFLLAEPDFRLRRIRGQVRVQFAGSSAKAVSQAGIASGDEVLLCLEGVEFVQNEGATISTPGRGVEFDLRFTERLVVEFRPEGSQEIKKINIDHPAAPPEIIPARPPTPETSLSPLPVAQTPQGEIDLPILAGGEWSSPAFIKRARTSYGSLFDSDYDPFSEEDGTVRGKGRKRTRLSSWRYNSRSPTPESEDQAMEQVNVQDSLPVKPAPTMMDEACQTIGLEEESAAEALANFSRQATNVGGNSYNMDIETAVGDTQDSEELESANQPMLPPVIHGTNGDELHLEITDASDAPKSPRLQPIPSDALSVVSPVLPLKAGLLDEIAAQAKAASDQHLSDQSMVGGVQIGVEDPEDLYNASPIRQREEEPSGGLVDHQNLPINGDVEAPPFTGNYVPEDQYDHWQSVNTQLDEANPPNVSDNRLPEGQYYIEQPQEVQYQDGPAYQDESQYPPLEDGLQDSGLPNWSFRPPVAYPDLPPPYGSREGSMPLAPPPNRSIAMSRSQSAISEQIDLTEDDDEPQQPRLGSPFEEDMEEEFDEEFDEEEENYLADGYEAEERENHLLQDGQVSELGDEEVGSDPGDSYYDEDELEEEFGEGEEVDEGSEMEDDEVPVKRTPEVIEIMSSDDEDEGIAPTQDSRRTQFPAHAHQEEHSEESDEDEESDTEDRILARSESEHDEQDSLIEDGESEDSQSDSEIEDTSLSRGRRIQSAESRRQELYPDIATTYEDKEGESDADMLEGETQVNAQQEDDAELIPIDSVSHSLYVSQPRKSGLQRPAVLSKQFSIDGANDDTEVTYPDLPGDEVSQLAVQSTGIVTETTKIETEKQGNAQLPTPADTQLSEKVLSAEQSFSSVSSIAVVESEQSPSAEDMQVETSERALEVETAAADVDMDHVEEDISPKLLEGAAEETSKDILQSSPPHTVLDTTVPGTLEEQFEPIVKEALIEASEEIQSQSSSSPSPVLDNSVPRTLEEEFEAIVKETVKEASEEIQTSSPQALAPDSPVRETLEKEFEAIVEEIEKEASEEIHSSSPPPAVSDAIALETLEQESETIVEEAEEEAESSPPFIPDMREPVSSDLKATYGEPLEQDLVEGTDELHSSSTKELQESAETMENALENVGGNQKGTSVGIVTNQATPQKGSPVAMVFEEVETTFDSPRRSARRPKPTPNALNQKENARPVTPVRATPRQTQDQVSPMVVLHSRETPKGHDASIELALAATDSPLKHDLRKPPVTDVKLRLSRALRTELSQYTPLKVLRYHMNQKMDVLGIATTSPPEPQRAKGGPRHYSVVFNITDPSIAPSGVAEVQVFRPYKDALPTIEVGDGVLLRNFQVLSVKKGFALRSMQDEGSSWAVFKDGMEPEIRGPPVEYGDGEKTHVAALKEWYDSLDSTSMAKIGRANGDKATPVSAGKGISKA